MTSGPLCGRTAGGETQRQQSQQQQQLPLTLADPVSPQPLLQPSVPAPAAPPADAVEGQVAAEGQVVEGGEEEEEPPWEEARRARRARDPGAPSVADWEAHQATHLPFRIWCQECVRGRRDNPAHARVPVPAEARGVAEVGLDSCFLRRADCEDKLTVLVQEESDWRALRTQVVASNRPSLRRSR